MKRILSIIIPLLLVAGFLTWLIPWLDRGGWPVAQPVGAALPPNIVSVSPADGQTASANHGFCLYFDYNAGRGMNMDAQKAIRYYFDGQDVSSHIDGAIDQEYPIGTGEPCYWAIERIKPGWHTAKVIFQDSSGNTYEYMWRFQVVEEE
jgi:hypothetical protein